MADTSVKFFLSSQSILPPLQAVAGSLKTVLKTCLVTGAGANNVASLTVEDGVATATYSTGHGYLDRQVVLFEGANEAPLNGEHRVTVTGSNTLTFETTLADGTATGTITSKLAPAGWEAEFEDGDVIVLRSLHEDSTGASIRVDDSGTTSARVCGYMEMTDIDTGTYQFPEGAQVAGGLYWPKAHNTTGTRPWAIVAAGRTFYYYVQPTSGNSAGSLLGFGDLHTHDGDPWAVFIAGHTTAAMTGATGCLSLVSTTPSPTICLPAAVTGAGGAIPAHLLSAMRSSGVSGNSTGSLYPTFPDPYRDEILLMPPMVVGECYRGTLPGVSHLPQAVIGRVGAFDLNKCPGYLPVTTEPAALSGVVLLDIFGPWRQL